MPTEAELAQTQIGLLQQATEYSQKKLAEYEAAQAKLDAAANAAYAARVAARQALGAAVSNPSTTPAQLAKLEANYDNLRNASITASTAAESNTSKVQAAQDAVSNNQIQAQNAAAAAGTGTRPVVSSAVEGAPVATETTGTVTSDPKPTTAYAVTEAAAGQGGSEAVSEFGNSPKPTVSYAATEAQAGQGGGEAVSEFGNSPKPVISSAVEGAAAGEGANPEAVSEFGNSPKPVMSEGLLAAQAASDTDTTEFVGEPKPVIGSAVGDAQSSSKMPSLEAAADAALAKAKAGPTAEPTLPAPEVKVPFVTKEDWRVRLSLAPNANYMYRKLGPDHIMAPLAKTDGVIFPYTPTISVSYNASYDPADLTHTNYKFYQYRNSSVGDITITGEFTAQDTEEANYLLAVIHFFKSVTKMFYGNDSNPTNGTPPPLCYLSGFGVYQFSNHPLAITNFSYNLPNDVDYIRAGQGLSAGGLQTFSPMIAASANSGVAGRAITYVTSALRLLGAGIKPGAKPADPKFTSASASASAIKDSTYVPTKMTISLTCIPMVSRYDISNKFSLEKYASGALSKHGGGMW